MSDITFTNGIRVFTPQQPASNAQSTISDFNNDGIIDILDVAEYLAAGPGGIPNQPTTENPPSVDPDEDLSDLVVLTLNGPSYCEDSSSELGFTFPDPSIITTGCNSIYNVDGTIDWPEWNPEDPIFCPEGKARGLTFDGSSLKYTSECTCVAGGDATFHVGSIMTAIFGGVGGKTPKAAKAAAKQVISRTISTAEDSLRAATKYRKFLDGMLEATDQAAKTYVKALEKVQAMIRSVKRKIERGFSERTGEKYTEKQIRIFELAVERAEKYADQLIRYLERDKIGVERILNEMKKFDDLIAKYKGVADEAKKLVTRLDQFNVDIESWLNGALMVLIPVGQFLVPKYCPSNQQLDANCNCVDKPPIVSGSYSSYTTMYMPDGYLIIESL